METASIFVTSRRLITLKYCLQPKLDAKYYSQNGKISDVDLAVAMDIKCHCLLITTTTGQESLRNALHETSSTHIKG